MKCVFSRVLLLNVEYSYYPFGIFLGGSGGICPVAFQWTEIVLYDPYIVLYDPYIFLYSLILF